MALLGVLVMIRPGQRDEGIRSETSAPTAAPATVGEQIDGAGIVWISHDWVEVAPQIHQDQVERAEQRRRLFGLDLVADGKQCTDSNCRACLIDLVFGREF